MAIQISYTPQQLEIFFNTKERFITIAKGRRFGFTRGAANFVIEELLDGRNWLWVDTINQNIQRYWERYFLPTMQNIPNNLWVWNKQDKKLFLNNSYLDMRSADNPQNIEGFGYDGVILNEAGIILKDKYIWENAIRPMLLDNPKSRAIIGGVPKGKNLFYQLAQKGLSNNKKWKHFRFSSYDNPCLSGAEIKELEEELGNSPNVIKQEIYGEFTDSATNELIPFQDIINAAQRNTADDSGSSIWGLDVARFGDDNSVLCKRDGYYVNSLVSWNGLDTIALANNVLAEFNKADKKPIGIFVEINGLGAGAYDVLRTYGLPVLPADTARKSETQECSNKRAEMYFKLSKSIKNMKIPYDNILISDLSQTEYFYNNAGKIQIIGKDAIKKEIGRSPDRSDALALTLYENVFVLENDEYWGER
jgi:hypothetical protein